MKRKFIFLINLTAVLCTCSVSFAEDKKNSLDSEILLELEETGSSSKISNSDDTVELDAIEIIDSIEADVRNGARPFFAQTIMSPEVSSINEWLESANGVYGDTSSKGTRSVMVRGFETRQLDIQFAGMPIDTGYDGITGLDALPMNWISAGRIAHADASPIDGVGFGGKIDIYAFDPSKLEANAEISRSGVIGSLSHGMNAGAWRWAATVGGMYSKGYYLSHAFEPCADENGGLRNWSDKKDLNFLIKAGRSLGDWGDIEVLAGWTQAPRSVPTGVKTDSFRYWRFTNWRMGFALTRFRFETSVLNGFVQIWANDQGNTLEAYDDEERNTQQTANASTSVWQDDDYGMRLELTSQPIALGDAGFLGLLMRTDLRYQRHTSHEKNYAPVQSSDKEASRFRYAVYPAIEWDMTSDIHLFAAGHAAGAVPVFQDNTLENEISVRLTQVHDGGFSVGLDYAILDNLDFNLRAARRLRLPTLKEQFRDIPDSNLLSENRMSELSPEIAWDIEAELHWKPIDEISFTIGVFDTEVRDLIESKYINGIKIAYNVNKARLAGTDIALKLGAWAGVSFDLSYHYLYAYDLSAEHELNDRPAHSFRGSVHYEPLENLRFTIGTQFESKRRTEAWMSSKSAWMGNIFLLNAEVEWHIEHFSMYIRGTNLTDYNYARTYGYPESGINIMIGGKIVY